jgi:hypothetical protein
MPPVTSCLPRRGRSEAKHCDDGHAATLDAGLAEGLWGSTDGQAWAPSYTIPRTSRSGREASLPEVRPLSRPWSLAILLVLGLTAACTVAFVVPPLVVSVHDVPDPVKRLELQNAVRTTLLSGMAGIFFLTTAYFTARQLQTARDQLSVSQAQLRISERGHVTERLTRAIDQLASTSRPAQVGAIYALERLAQDHEELRSTFVETISAYVREHTPCTPQRDASRLRQRRMRVDLQVALTVLSRAAWLAQWRWEDSFKQVVDDEIVVAHSALNLAYTDLRFAVLPKAELPGPT